MSSGNNQFLVIVAFGDSLTVGFQNRSTSNPFGLTYAYTRVLNDLMWGEVKKLGVNIFPVLENEGAVGESTKGMLRRFDYAVTRHRPNIVVIWGGLNDIASGVDPKDVVENLKSIAEKVRQIGATPVLCCLTPVVAKIDFLQIIQETNKLISDMAMNEKIILVDLYAPLAGNDGLLKREYNNDGAHLSNEGYRAVGELIFREAIQHILSNLKTEK